ncbi:ABC-2 type transport system permease protein [Chishuiella changwenlii]|uniref:ABC transporter permease n=1 Tax=Chishuiella changwenlii TaxID=1434701 RepID=A0A1M7ARE8_9FLAO|nr:ABC transporter permease [Chishuiella changwenlii]GGE91071.1 ABC transporter permease [Chishuiella changwenlii]SHL45314.1 ABC-2 type transport system permease protein [Chishuiella changwenlii]
MKNIFLIAQREFFSQVKNKAFIIMTFLSPLLIAGAGAVIFFLSSANNSEVKNVAIVDESAEFLTSFKSSKQMMFSIYTPQELQSIKDTLKDSEYLNAILYIPKNTDGNYSNIEKNTQLFTNGNLGITDREKLAHTISDKIEKHKQLKAGINLVDLDSSKARVNINVYNVKDGKEDTGVELKIALSIFLTYIIFMFVMIYGVKVMRSVVEEKNNRVVEIIISSVKPFDLMMGKILGTTLVAVTQFAIWIAMTMSLLLAFPVLASSRIDQAQIMMNQTQMAETNPDMMHKVTEISEVLLTFNYPLIIFTFIAYFVLGYLFYSSVFAAIGSAVDNDTDTQQFTYFPLVPMMIGLYGSMTTFENPDGPVAFWLSMIPLTSPISMITRIPFDVPMWQLALSLFLLLISTIFMVYVASKIYRIGILIYGKKPTVKEIIKWINYKN